MDAELVFRLVLIVIASVALVSIIVHYNRCMSSGAGGEGRVAGETGRGAGGPGSGGGAPPVKETYANYEEERNDYFSPVVPPTRPEPSASAISAVEETVDELPAAVPQGQGYGGPMKPSDLLPKLTPEAQQFSQLYPCGQGDLSGLNFLESGTLVGQSTNLKRNANLQLRSDPPIPYKNVSPWQMSTIRPDCHQRTFELGQS
jgi:hypothetical protein